MAAATNIVMGHSLGGCIAIRIHNKALSDTQSVSESSGLALVLVAPALPSFRLKTEESAPAQKSSRRAFVKILTLIWGWSAYLALKAVFTLLSPIITLVVRLAVPKTNSAWARMMVCSLASSHGLLIGREKKPDQKKKKYLYSLCVLA